MLAHSPPFPLIIDYNDEHDVLTVEDEEAIVLVQVAKGSAWCTKSLSTLSVTFYGTTRFPRQLEQGLLQKLVVAMDGEYPVLEYLILGSSKQDRTTLTFPGTLQAPHLRHLTLLGFANPIGSRLFTAAVGLATLYLIITHPHAYLQPDTHLQ